MSTKEVRGFLHNISTTSSSYESAYEETMRRIQSQNVGYKDLAWRVLLWITHARRQLTVAELREALAVEAGTLSLDPENQPEAGDMVSACAGLVTIENGSNIIRLVHYTTQEYFGQTRAKWFPEAESDITTACLTYISFDAFGSGLSFTDEDFQQRLDTNQLYDYAAKFWGHHARLCRRLVDLVLDFLKKEGHVLAASQGLIVGQERSPQRAGYSSYFPRKWTGLHMSAYFGIQRVVEAFIYQQGGLDIEDSYMRTPLFYAARNGHEAVVKMLLDTKQVFINRSDIFGETSLFGAVVNGHGNVAKILLDIEVVHVDGKDAHGRSMLSWAAFRGLTTVVSMLLATGRVDVNSKDLQYGQTPLSWACERGHEAVVKLLLHTEGIDANSRSSTGHTPLLYAAENGHGSVVAMLLNSGKVDLESKDTRFGETPLSWAAENCHEAVVKMLVERGADIATVSASGWTPLTVASACGQLAVIKLLVGFGIDITASNNIGMTPLIAASATGHLEVVKFLLERGADIAGTAGDACTPLEIASDEGHLEVVKLLIDSGADMTTKSTGSTPLILSSSSGHLEVVKLLLDKGADITTTDIVGNTPLHAASLGGHPDVVELCLDHQLDTTPIPTNADGCTPLILASKGGHVQVLRILIARDVSPVNHADWHGSTALFAAVRNGHSDAVELLLSVDHINCNLKDGFGRTLFWWAKRRGNPRVSELLLPHVEASALQIEEHNELTANNLEPLAPFDEDSPWCEACLLSIADQAARFTCDVCSGGNFRLCVACYEMGVKCRDSSHSLTRGGFQASSEEFGSETSEQTDK